MPDVEQGRSYKIAFRNEPGDPHFGKMVKVKQREDWGDCLVMLPNGRHLRYHESLLRTELDFEKDNEDLLKAMARRAQIAPESRSLS